MFSADDMIKLQRKGEEVWASLINVDYQHIRKAYDDSVISLSAYSYLLNVCSKVGLICY